MHEKAQNNEPGLFLFCHIGRQYLMIRYHTDKYVGLSIERSLDNGKLILEWAALQRTMNSLAI